MSIFRRIFRKDPEQSFSKGREAFDKGKYSLASKLFEKAYQQYDIPNMKIISIENAAIAAEYADNFERSLNLYYKTICNKIRTEPRPKSVLPDFDKVFQIFRLSEKPSIPLFNILLLKFLILLSEKDFDQLTSFYNKLKIDTSDQYGRAIEESWALIHSSDTFEKKKQLPQVDLPEEFEQIYRNAERVMQRCSLCEIVLESDDKMELIEKGIEFSLSTTLTAHAPMSIQKIHLKTGTKGRIITSSTPELPLKLSTGENYSILYSLIPNLPGEWLLGPMSIIYTIPSEQGEYPSTGNTISINVNDAAPALKLSMESKTIEEDLEYMITISVENVGKTTLQNVKIVTEIPEEVKIHEGTNEKFISTLVEGETFQYEMLVRFALDKSHLSGHIIKANGFIKDNQRLAKSSVKLGGS